MLHGSVRGARGAITWAVPALVHSFLQQAATGGVNDVRARVDADLPHHVTQVELGGALANSAGRA